MRKEDKKFIYEEGVISETCIYSLKKRKKRKQIERLKCLTCDQLHNANVKWEKEGKVYLFI